MESHERITVGDARKRKQIEALKAGQPDRYIHREETKIPFGFNPSESDKSGK